MAQNRYDQILERVFLAKWKAGATKVNISRSEFDAAADALKLERVKNLGDIPYTYRYRKNLPASITSKAPEGLHWIIRGVGDGKYQFALTKVANFTPSENLVATKIPDSTPGIITKYAFSDEQALLAIIRYNRLIDIFTGITCYSLQSHLRTKVAAIGQVETDELYVGVNKSGAHYAIPVQAKGNNDKMGPIQVEQDLALCKERFPNLIALPIGAQFIQSDLVAMFAFEVDEGGDVKIQAEKHYRLVEPSQITDEELAAYRQRIEG